MNLNDSLYLNDIQVPAGRDDFGPGARRQSAGGLHPCAASCRTRAHRRSRGRSGRRRGGCCSCRGRRRREEGGGQEGRRPRKTKAARTRRRKAGRSSPAWSRCPAVAWGHGRWLGRPCGERLICRLIRAVRLAKGPRPKVAALAERVREPVSPHWALVLAGQPTQACRRTRQSGARVRAHAAQRRVLVCG